MNEKKYCISFEYKKYFIYPILIPISCMFTHFFQKIMYENSKPDKSYIILKYNFAYLFYYFLPKIFSFIFILIIKYNTKREGSKVQNKLIRRYHFIIKNENFKKIIFYIYIISLFEVIFKIADSLLLYLQKIDKIHYLIEKRTGFIVSVPLFSYLLLNKKLYKHHIFALILTLIGAFVITLARFILGFSKVEEYLYHILNLLFSFIFSFSLVLIKYIMIKFLISPYFFLFYDGLFCIINLIICVFLEYPLIININDYMNSKIDVKKENDRYFINNYLKIFTLYSQENTNFYFSLFFSFISSFCYFIFNVLTIFRFSPYLNVLTDFLTPFLYNIFNFIFLEDDRSHKNLYRYFFEFIGHIIIIIGASILNELIILNFFGLNENTYEKISERGSLDFKIEPYLVNSEDTITITENETEAEITNNND